jgi:hypothetical protein
LFSRAADDDVPDTVLPISRHVGGIGAFGNLPGGKFGQGCEGDGVTPQFSSLFVAAGRHESFIFLCSLTVIPDHS